MCFFLGIVLQPQKHPKDLVLRVSKLDEARSKLLEAGKVADTEIAKLDAIIDDMENQQLDGNQAWQFNRLVIAGQ